MPTGELSGENGEAALTMEEKLLRWKQTKSQKQKTAKSSKSSTIGSSRHDVRGNGASVGVKRSLTKVKAMGHQSKSTTAISTPTPRPKKFRASPDCNRKASNAGTKSFSTSSSADNVKTQLSVSTGILKASPETRNQEGNPQCLIVIDDYSEKPVASSSSKVRGRPLSTTATSTGTPKPVSEMRSQEGSPQCAFVLNNDSELRNPLCQSFPPPSRITKHSMTRSKVNDRETRIMNQTALPQQPVPMVPSPEVRQNNREVPISASQPIPNQSSIPKQKIIATSRVIWSEDPTFDKENQSDESILPNQNLPAPGDTVEKQPELLAKDLIRVAIGFEKKRRLATAFSVFKRANHILPKQSAKLTERIARLEQECSVAAFEPPSQDLTTSAYMVQVLERDLMSVLNHGSTVELTELHAIGAKRSEVVFDRRPYHQVCPPSFFGITTVAKYN
ncbi:unnamed protein product [Phytophthora fragariaefolia]|uniref:Unnamed protein product n=1 Tax=Phytophthora fragariaefolia TaxID=1490495 RepID=A0A9W7CXZ9_9STRA|nr:unnamed protein product [Phytophthora fragariaefolia]